jgi:hypothetical protein
LPPPNTSHGFGPCLNNTALLTDVIRYCADPDQALALVVQSRWPSGVKCPTTSSATSTAMHADCLENFWPLFKRSIKGTYVSVDPFHLFRYVDEQVYCFNARKGTDLTRLIGVLKEVVGRRITYNELIGADMKTGPKAEKKPRSDTVILGPASQQIDARLFH